MPFGTFVLRKVFALLFKSWLLFLVSFTNLIQVLLTSKLTIFSWVVRLLNHMGAEKHPTVGSSGEYWSMNESLNQRFA